jgi:hypothetical protein
LKLKVSLSFLTLSSVMAKKIGPSFYKAYNPVDFKYFEYANAVLQCKHVNL